ncbi:hypothetical protein LguiA_030297 [Lonicera macranthoides]
MPHSRKVDQNSGRSPFVLIGTKSLFPHRKDLLLNSNWIVKMMIQSKDESWRSKSEDSSSGRLLHDIEEISKALYLQKNPPKALILPSD